MYCKEKNQGNTQTKRSEKITMKKFKRGVKGITLIALVVTIIVLLILAGVALNLTIGQNGIFQRAQGAANTWRNAEANEQLALGEGANLIDQYLNGNGGTGNSGSGNDNPGTGTVTALGAITGEETTNTVTKDKYGNPITIPAGFKVVNPDDDVTKGIIIEDVSAPGKTSDTKGSQFVWIPVGDVYTSAEHTEANKKTITLGRYTFDETTGEEHLVQPGTSYASETELRTSSTGAFYEQELLNTSISINEKAKDLKAFVTKVLESRGYYIGCYEAGDTNAKDSERTGESNESNPNNPITCKAGVYPYTYVNQMDAAGLCQEMYESSNFESDLINSYAWDTAIVFIQKCSGDADYSIQFSLQNEIARCGEATDGVNNDIRCNIYDMAGNTLEWTTETRSTSLFPYVYRGGYYKSTSCYTSSRAIINYTTKCGYYISFRPILYL